MNRTWRWDNTSTPPERVERLGKLCAMFGWKFLPSGDGNRIHIRGGSLASFNTTEQAFHANLTWHGEELAVELRSRGWPWTRKKSEQALEDRADEIRVALGDFKDPMPGLRPGHAGTAYAHYARRGASFLCGLGLILILFWVAGIFWVGQAEADLAARAGTVSRAGEIPLPSPADLESRTFLDRAWAGLFLALPLTFLFSLLLGIFNLCQEINLKLARMSTFFHIWAAFFVGIWFVPATPLLGIMVSVATPLLFHLGWSFPWGLSGSGERDQALAQSRVVRWGITVISLVALAQAGIHGLRIETTAPFTEIRDQVLYPHESGRILVNFYYEHTLYAAEVIRKPIDRPHRIIRLVGLTPDDVPLLKNSPYWVPVSSASIADATLVTEDSGDVAPSSDMPVVYVESAAEARSADTVLLLERAIKKSDPNELIRYPVSLGLGALQAATLPLALLLTLVFCLHTGWLVRFGTPSLKARGVVTWSLALGWITVFVWLVASSRGPIADLREIPDDPTLRADYYYTLVPDLDDSEWPNAADRSAVLGRAVEDLASPDPRLRLGAIRVLGTFGTSVQLEYLTIPLREDADLSVRYHAAWAIGRIGPGKAREELQSAIQSAPWYVGLYAWRALHP